MFSARRKEHKHERVSTVSKRLLLDVDGTIACCASAVHEFAEHIFDRPMPHWSSWNDFSFESSLGLNEVETRIFFDEAKYATFPLSIRLYPGVAHTIEVLKQKYEIVFVTSHWKFNSNWVCARERLLEQFNCPIVFTHHKYLVSGDILVDDRPATLLDARGSYERICYSQPWNANTDLGSVRRISSLEELL